MIRRHGIGKSRREIIASHSVGSSAVNDVKKWKDQLQPVMQQVKM
jgi:hypothetical protein